MLATGHHWCVHSSGDPVVTRFAQQMLLLLLCRVSPYQQMSFLAAAAMTPILSFFLHTFTRCPPVKTLTHTQLPPCSAAFADDGKVLCDASCVSALESKEMVTTATGLQYKEIKAGTGPQAITGYQVTTGNPLCPSPAVPCPAKGFWCLAVSAVL